MIPPTRLDDAAVERLVSRMRNPGERRGDLRAQLAAHHLAERRLRELCDRRGRKAVEAAMAELLAYSERVVRTALRELPDGAFDGRDVLETPYGDPPAARHGDDRGRLDRLSTSRGRRRSTPGT